MSGIMKKRVFQSFSDAGITLEIEPRDGVEIERPEDSEELTKLYNEGKTHLKVSGYRRTKFFDPPPDGWTDWTYERALQELGLPGPK
jgi:hypothetical protein